MRTTITRTARETERGQTLPIWAFAVLASLALMFFTLNYANVVRAQVRAQTVADMVAQTMLGVQATRWNKLTMALYAADVEEWRIRSLIASMYDAANEEGLCRTVTDAIAVPHSCINIYNALVPQYYKAVIRYKADAYAIDATDTSSGATMPTSIDYATMVSQTENQPDYFTPNKTACGYTPP